MTNKSNKRALCRKYPFLMFSHPIPKVANHIVSLLERIIRSLVITGTKTHFPKIVTLPLHILKNALFCSLKNFIWTMFLMHAAVCKYSFAPNMKNKQTNKKKIRLLSDACCAVETVLVMSENNGVC